MSPKVKNTQEKEIDMKSAGVLDDLEYSMHLTRQDHQEE